MRKRDRIREDFLSSLRFHHHEKIKLRGSVDAVGHSQKVHKKISLDDFKEAGEKTAALKSAQNISPTDPSQKSTPAVQKDQSTHQKENTSQTQLSKNEYVSSSSHASQANIPQARTENFTPKVFYAMQSIPTPQHEPFLATMSNRTSDSNLYSSNSAKESTNADSVLSHSETSQTNSHKETIFGFSEHSQTIKSNVPSEQSIALNNHESAGLSNAKTAENFSAHVQNNPQQTIDTKSFYAVLKSTPNLLIALQHLPASIQGNFLAFPHVVGFLQFVALRSQPNIFLAVTKATFGENFQPEHLLSMMGFEEGNLQHLMQLFGFSPEFLFVLQNNPRMKIPSFLQQFEKKMMQFSNLLFGSYLLKAKYNSSETKKEISQTELATLLKAQEEDQKKKLSEKKKKKVSKTSELYVEETEASSMDEKENSSYFLEDLSEEVHS